MKYFPEKPTHVQFIAISSKKIFNQPIVNCGIPEFHLEFWILIKCWVVSHDEYLGWQFLTTNWRQLICTSLLVYFVFACLFCLQLKLKWFMWACSSVCKTRWFCLLVVVLLTAVLALCCFSPRFSHSFIIFMDGLMDEHNCSITCKYFAASFVWPDLYSCRALSINKHPHRSFWLSYNL